MKVAIINTSFFESTFPMIKELNKTISVDCYSIMSVNNLGPPNFDIKKNYNGELGILTDKEKLMLVPKEIKSYFSNDMSFLKLTILDKYFNGKYLNRLCRIICDSNYDILHFVGIHLHYNYLLNYFKNKTDKNRFDPPPETRKSQMLMICL